MKELQKAILNILKTNSISDQTSTTETGLKTRKLQRACPPATPPHPSPAGAQEKKGCTGTPKGARNNPAGPPGVIQMLDTNQNYL